MVFMGIELLSMKIRPIMSMTHEYYTVETLKTGLLQKLDPVKLLFTIMYIQP